MAIYRLPDNKLIELPDDLSSDEKNEFQNWLADTYPDFYETPAERNFLGHTSEILKGIPRGGLQTLASSVEGVVNLFDTGNDSEVGESLRSFQESLNENAYIGVGKGYEDAFSTKLGAGLGSFASFVIPGTIAGKGARLFDEGLSAADKLKKSTDFATRGAAAVAIPAGIAEQGRSIERARELGEDVNFAQEVASEIAGGAIGFTEILPALDLLKFIPKGSAAALNLNSRLKRAIATGTGEAIQETTAGLLQDAVARGIYSDKLPIGDSAFDDFTVGGAVGFIADLALRGPLGKYGAGAEYLKDSEKQAREKLNAAKFAKRELYEKTPESRIEDVDPALFDDVDLETNKEAEQKRLELVNVNNFKEPPVLDEVLPIANANGTASILGQTTGKEYGIAYPDFETAAVEALKIQANINENYIHGTVNQSLYLQGNYGNGTAYNIGRKILDPEFNDIPAVSVASLDSSISPKRKIKLSERENAERQINEQMAKDILGEARATPERIAKLTSVIASLKNSLPLRTSRVDKDSLLGQLQTKAKKLGLPIKKSYTIPETKKLLSKTDFNDLMSEKAAIVYKRGVQDGKLFPSRRLVDFVEPGLGAIKKTLEQKNIETNVNDPAFQFFAKQVTGEKDYSKMNRGQKELLATRLKEIPRFDYKTKFPDFSPRPYTAKAVDDFYQNNRGDLVTNDILKENIKTKDGKNLSQKQLQTLREDLVSSERAIKDKNRLKLTYDFENVQSRKAAGLNESPEELRQRLQETSSLSDEEINQRIERDDSDTGEVLDATTLQLPPPARTPERLKMVFDRMREYLNGLGLSDIGLQITNDIKGAANLREVDGELVFDKIDPNQTEGAFDPNIRKIFLTLQQVDPSGTKTAREIEAGLTSILNHEVVHALRELDLIKESEYKTLIAFAKNTLTKVKSIDADGVQINDIERINKVYEKKIKVLNPETNEMVEEVNPLVAGKTDAQIQEIKNEEYVAELFRYYRDNPKKVKGKTKTVIQRVLAFFKAIADSLFGTGYRQPIEILEDIATGKIGKRERDRIRSNKDFASLTEEQQKRIVGDSSIDVPVIPFKQSVSRDTIEKELEDAYSELSRAESILRVDGDRVSARNYDRMYAEYQRANNKVYYLQEQLKKIPKDPPKPVEPEQLEFKFSKKNIVPRDPVAVERQLSQEEKRNILDGEFVYHVTSTKNARKIAEEGFNIFADSNYVRGDGSRYQDSPGVFVFKNPYDAVAFVKRVNWQDEDNFSMIKLRKGDRRYEADKAADFQLHPIFSSNTAEDLGVELNEFSLNELTRGQEDKSGNTRTTYYVPSLQTPEPFKPEDIVGIVTFPDMEKAFKDPVIDFRQYNNHSEVSSMSDLDNPSPFGFSKIIDDLFSAEEVGVTSFKFSQSAISPRDIFFAGDIERIFLEEFKKNNGNLTGKKIEEIAEKELGLKPSPDRQWVSIKDLRDTAQASLDNGTDPYWYTRFGQEAKALVGASNIPEFSAVFGITSEQGKVEDNYKDALQTMIIARQINPETNPKEFVNTLREFGVGKRERRRLGRILDYYQTGILKREGTGQKTATYALEIQNAANNTFTPFTVIDRHMLRFYGLTGKDKTSATNTEYRIMQAMNALVADFYGNTFKMKDGTPINLTNPSELQALIWDYQRYSGATKINNEAQFASSKKTAAKQISEINLMIETGRFNKERPFSDKFVHAPRFTTKERGGFDTNISDAHYNAILNNSSVLAVEVNPGFGRRAIPYDATIDGKRITQADYFNNFLKVVDAITDGNQIRAFSELGIPNSLVLSAGSYQGSELALNMIARFPNSSKQEMLNYAKIMGDALLQDSVMYLKPIPRGKQASAVIFEKKDGNQFTQEELNNLTLDLKLLDPDAGFTQFAGSRVGPMILDSNSFRENIEYDGTVFQEFLDKMKDLADNSGYTLRKFGNDVEFVNYEKEEGNTTGYRGAYEQIRNRGSAKQPSDIQRVFLSNLHIPAYKIYREFAGRVDNFSPVDAPYYSEDSSLGKISPEVLESADVLREIQEINSKDASTVVSRFNTNADPLALTIAFKYDKGTLSDEDIPGLDFKYSRKSKIIPDEFQSLYTQEELNNKQDEDLFSSIRRVVTQGEESGDTSLDNTTKKPELSFLTRLYQNFVDKLSVVEKKLIESADTAAERGDTRILELQQWAYTGAIQALRHADKANAIVGQMLTKGIPFIARGDKTYGLTSIVDFEYEGETTLLGNFGKLFDDPSLKNLDGELLFQKYMIAIRSEQLAEAGMDVPMTPEQIELAKKIGTQFPVIKRVSDFYQAYNAKVIDYAVATGILEGVRDTKDLAKDIVAVAKDKEISGYSFKRLKDLSLEELIAEANLFNTKFENEKDYVPIRTKSTSEIWKEAASYYPFYRKMVDEKVRGPNVASGFLSGNPLNIKLKGSEEVITPAPLDVIFRNYQAIVTAAMKNEGLQRLVNEHKMAGRATLASEGTPIDKKFDVFENGKKVTYEVADSALIYGLQSMNMGDDTGFLSGILATPASILRETVTRDPIFMFRNLIRDSLVSRTITGATYTPIIDTFKEINSDMDSLERFGIIGGYDAARDPRDAAKFFKTERKRRAYDEYGSMNPLDTVAKMWDVLGRATTVSDGATRMAVSREILERTGSQAEASYQALEIMNFNRRGGNPIFKVVTSAIPFFNARIQGLDVLRRASYTGSYSAIKKLDGKGASRDELAREIVYGTLLRGLFLASITGLYYALVSDDEHYKNARRETRDDNWIVPIAEDIPALKIPIPFEVGVLFKVIPERFIDLLFGDATFNETMTSLQRQAIVTFKMDLLGFQLVKPFTEVVTNRSSYLGTSIIPFYLQDGVKTQAQYTENTTEFSKELSKGLENVGINVAPIHLDYLITGYTGTIGVYLSAVADAIAKSVTGVETVPRDIERLPFFRSILQGVDGGGLSQEFYEMRKESNQFIGTVNKLIKEGRKEELDMYYNNSDGLIETREEILKLDRFLADVRRRKQIIRGTDSLSPQAKKTLIDQLDNEVNRRLGYFLPEIKERLTG